MYKWPGPRVKFSAEALLCHLRDHVNISMIEATDFPFNTSDWEGYLPQEDIRTKAGPWGRCAVVSSAGSLKSSRLGREIGGFCHVETVIWVASAHLDHLGTWTGVGTSSPSMARGLVEQPSGCFSDVLHGSEVASGQWREWGSSLPAALLIWIALFWSILNTGVLQKILFEKKVPLLPRSKTLHKHLKIFKA